MLIEAEHLSVTFGGVRAVQDVSFHLEAGEMLGIIGPNGAGKTTLFNAVSGFAPLADGSVAFEGERIDGMKPHQLTRRGLVRTFQATRDFEHLTVAEHIRLVPGCDVNSSETGSLIEQLGLGAYLRNRPFDLPYGTRRDLGLLMALLLRPRCLLVDEPSSGLTDSEADRVAALLLSVASSGVGVAVIDHNVGFVRALSDRVMALDAGRMVAIGSAQEIFESELVRKVYLGE